MTKLIKELEDQDLIIAPIASDDEWEDDDEKEEWDEDEDDWDDGDDDNDWDDDEDDDEEWDDDWEEDDVELESRFVGRIKSTGGGGLPRRRPETSRGPDRRAERTTVRRRPLAEADFEEDGPDL